MSEAIALRMDFALRDMLAQASKGISLNVFLKSRSDHDPSESPFFPCSQSVRPVCTPALAALMVSPLQTHAGAFDAGVSPSRFEVSAKSGGRLGQTLEIFNQDGQPTELSVRTLDWEYSKKGELKFFDELRPGSCRPWFTLERAQNDADRCTQQGIVSLSDRCAGRRRRDGVPGDAGHRRREARLSGDGAIRRGQLGLARQRSVGGGDLCVHQWCSTRAVDVADKPDAEGPAFDGFRDGDEYGHCTRSTRWCAGREGCFRSELELVPDGTPILPGQTRNIVLKPRALAGTAEPKVVYHPVKASGALDWENGSFKINAEFH